MSAGIESKPQSRSVFTLLLAQIPLIVAVVISLESNRLAREQLRSSEQSLQRTFAPLLATEIPMFQEEYKGGQPSHYTFFTRIFNVSENPAFNLSANLTIGDKQVLEKPLELPVLFGNNVPEEKAGFLKSLAVSAKVPTELAGAVLDGDPIVRLVIEHDDSFGNRMKQIITYRVAAQGQMATVNYQHESITK